MHCKHTDHSPKEIRSPVSFEKIIYINQIDSKHRHIDHMMAIYRITGMDKRSGRMVDLFSYFLLSTACCY